MLARGKVSAGQSERGAIFTSESTSTLPREGAEQLSSAIAYKSVPVGTLISLAQVREDLLPGVPLQNGAQKPFAASGQAKCARLCGLLRFASFFKKKKRKFFMFWLSCNAVVLGLFVPSSAPACAASSGLSVSLSSVIRFATKSTRRSGPSPSCDQIHFDAEIHFACAATDPLDDQAHLTIKYAAPAAVRVGLTIKSKQIIRAGSGVCAHFEVVDQ